MQAAEIFAVVVDRGSWHCPVDELEHDPLELRRQLRALAKERGIRLRTMHGEHAYVVWWPEHEPTELQRRASARVIRTLGTEDGVTFDAALELERRRTIRPLGDD